MKLLSGLFRSRDKPRNSTSGSSYRFFYGQSSSGKCVTERSAMQMTALLCLAHLNLTQDEVWLMPFGLLLDLWNVIDSITE